MKADPDKWGEDWIENYRMFFQPRDQLLWWYSRKHNDTRITAGHGGANFDIDSNDAKKYYGILKLGNSDENQNDKDREGHFEMYQKRYGKHGGIKGFFGYKTDKTFTYIKDKYGTLKFDNMSDLSAKLGLMLDAGKAVYVLEAVTVEEKSEEDPNPKSKLPAKGSAVLA